MNAKLIAAAVLSIAANAAFAADSAAPAAAVQTAAAAQVTAAAASLNLPTVQVSQTTGRTRAEVREEAIAHLKNYKSTLAVQLEQYTN